MFNWKVFISSGILFVANVIDAVSVTPATVDGLEGIDVTVPNPGNSIVNGKWKQTLPINGWGLQLTLSAEQYAFSTSQVSSVTVSLDDVECVGSECDSFYSFSVGDTQFFSLLHDRDGGLWAASAGRGGTGGVFMYPNCNEGNALGTGDPILLLEGIESDWAILRSALSQGNGFQTVTTARIGKNKPLTFTFTNDPINDVFTVDFVATGSSSFSSMSCTYKSVDPCKDLKLYYTPDSGDGAEYVTGFTVTSDNTGITDECSLCVSAGLNMLSESHSCRCRAECGVDYCNAFSKVTKRLKQSLEVGEEELCEDGEVCCCSCPNCRNHIEA